MSFKYPSNILFQCVKCGICCGNTPEKVRHILLLRSEANKISIATNKPISEFASKIANKTPYSYEMTKTEKGNCPFLKNNQCTIYPQRPLICHFYPFELKNTNNQPHEFHHTNECPGIGKGKTLKKTHYQKLFQLANYRVRVERRHDECQTEN
jgi:Fe-S-cluster containining protein